MFCALAAVGRIAQAATASTTVYNRFHRWSAKGIWRQLFEALAQTSDRVVLHLTGLCLTLCGDQPNLMGIIRALRLCTRSAIHGALDRLQSIDLAFRLTIAPRHVDGVTDSVDIAAKNAGKAG